MTEQRSDDRRCRARARRLPRSRHRLTPFLVGAVAAAVLLGSCAGDDGERSSDNAPYEVTSHALAHEMTQSMRVWRPAAEGKWPVVYALPGSSGELGRDLDQLGPALAKEGLVVFATDVRVGGTPDQQTQDLECGYRYARLVAGDYGGDLTAPVTVLGYSLTAGAVLNDDPALFGPGGSYDVCFAGVPPAEVRVAINGCYFAHEGQHYPFPADRLPISKSDSLLMIAGQVDQDCPPWESRRAAQALEGAGFEVTLDVISGADHFAAIFHDLVGEEWRTVPDSPAGEQVVRDVVKVIRSRAAAQSR